MSKSSNSRRLILCIKRLIATESELSLNVKVAVLRAFATPSASTASSLSGTRAVIVTVELAPSTTCAKLTSIFHTLTVSVLDMNEDFEQLSMKDSL